MSRSPSNSLDAPASAAAPRNSLDAPGSLADAVLLTVASSSSDMDRFAFDAAALDSLAALANPQAKTFENKHDARRSVVVDFIMSDKERSQTSDSSLPNAGETNGCQNSFPFGWILLYVNNAKYVCLPNFGFLSRIFSKNFGTIDS